VNAVNPAPVNVCPAHTAPALFDAAFVADPYPAYAALREEGRVRRVTLPGGVEAWLMTRYDDCRRAFLDTTSFSKDMAGSWTAFQEQRVPLTGDVVIGMGDSMLVSDPPRHTRLRALVAKGFTPRRIEALAPAVEQAAARLLDGLLSRTGELAGRADRDAERFFDPETFDITRGERAHLAFGHGIHHCLGAPLARLEARIAVPLVFARLPALALAGEPAYRPSTVSRALSSLPVTFVAP
jgi:cytochrome P450